MKLSRKFLALALTAAFAVPGPAMAQTIRVAIEAPVGGVPALTVPVPFALSAPSLVAPSLSPLTASFPVLSAPAITPVLVAVPAALAPVVPVAAKPADMHPTHVEALVAGIKPAPSAPDASAETRKAGADTTFDGSIAKEESAAVPAESYVVEKESDVDLKLSKLGRVPPPRPWIEKGKVLLAYGGLSASAVAMHAPFDRIGPLVIGLIMAVPLTFMWMMFYTASQSVGAGTANAEAKVLAQTEDPKPSAESLALIARLAVEAKVPPPARVKIMPGDKVNAQVGLKDDAGYEIRFTKSFEALRPDVQEAIMRHEFAHQRHHDMSWQVVKMFLTTIPIMVGLLGMTDKPDVMGVLVAAITAAAVLLFPVSLQHSEYLADQYAASHPEGAGPLARFFIEDSEKPERAASALSGREFSSETGWRRRAIMFWDSLKRVFSAHPSHDRRIARLVRLAEKKP